MGVYNCADTIEEAIESLYKQTYKDWELILCDDGSTDNTYSIAERITRQNSNKITLLKNDNNKGLNYTLNRCLQVASGEYIARMDGDDISCEERFEKQVHFLDQNPDFAIVSSDMVYFDETGTFGYIRHPQKPIPKDLLYGTPFCHAPCMVRRKAYMAVNGYSDDVILLRVEDYHLWLKMYEKGYRGYNIHEILYKMRDDRKASQRRKFKYRLNEAYVRFLVIRKFKFNFLYCIFVLYPILVGMLPSKLYFILHRIRLNNKQIS